MRHLVPTHPRRIAAGAAALVLIGVAVSFLALGQDTGPDASPPPPPVPHVTVGLDGEWETLAGAAEHIESETGAAMLDLLRELYERAFLPPLPAPAVPEGQPTPAVPPTPVPRPPPDDLVLDPARGPFAAHRDAFSPGEDTTLGGGHVGFHGMVVAEGAQVHSALVAVRFEGEGHTQLPEGRRWAKVVQHGQLLVVPTEGGWRVAGFEVTLEVHRQQAAPLQSPQAMARWMP